MLAALAAAMPSLGRSNQSPIRKDNPTRADTNHATGGRQVMVKGVPVHYEVRGSGRPMIMIHGFVVDSRSLMGSMEPIFARKAGWRRIYFDMPGMGKTPASEAIASSDEMLDLVLSFIDAV